MLKKILFGLIIFSSCLTLSAQSINTGKSLVTFEIGNIMVNNVSGTFKGMHGKIKFNKSNLAASIFSVCIESATVNSENEKRDEHLKKADFFDVEKFPEICFVSTKIEKTDAGFKASGDLTIRDITKTVEIPFTFGNKTFNGNLKINRLDYEIGVNHSGLTVGKEVTLEIVCVVR